MVSMWCLAWDYSTWVRTYSLFLEERLECFRVLKYDVETDPLVCISFSFFLLFDTLECFICAFNYDLNAEHSGSFFIFYTFPFSFSLFHLNSYNGTRNCYEYSM